MLSKIGNTRCYQCFNLNVLYKCVSQVIDIMYILHLMKYETSILQGNKLMHSTNRTTVVA
jgi:hypothetical protein